jgi:mono/diheme cytochrome c family protein
VSRPGWIAALAVTALLALGAPPALAGPPPIVKPSDEARLPSVKLGEQLYAGNCLSCHGIAGKGESSGAPDAGGNSIRELGPPLRNVGALAPDFYLSTGYMPVGDAHDQPVRSRPAFDARER